MSDVPSRDGVPDPRQSADDGMEHRWRVPYTVLWPHLASDYYETSAESREEAKANVAALLNRRCTLSDDWRFNGEPKLIA